MSEEIKKNVTPEDAMKQSQSVLPDGTTVVVGDHEAEIKTVVRRQFAGEDVVSRVAELKPAEDTVHIDREFVDDWDEKEYIVNLIEGKYQRMPDGRQLPLTTGFKQICGMMANFRLKLTVDPSYKQFMSNIIGEQFKVWLEGYRTRPETMNMELGLKLWFDAVLETIEVKLIELKQQLAVNQIDERTYTNAKSVVVDRCKDAIMKYRAGQIQIDYKKKPWNELSEAEKARFMDSCVLSMKGA